VALTAMKLNVDGLKWNLCYLRQTGEIKHVTNAGTGKHWIHIPTVTRSYLERCSLGIQIDTAMYYCMLA
jgi:hypothetical protein